MRKCKFTIYGLILIIGIILVYEYSFFNNKKINQKNCLSKPQNINIIEKQAEKDLNNLTGLINTNDNKKIEKKLYALLNKEYLIIYFYDEKHKFVRRSIRFTNNVPKGYYMNSEKWCEKVKKNKGNILITKNKKYKILNLSKYYHNYYGNAFIVGIDILVR